MTNSGGGALAWTATSSAGWLKVSSSLGTALSTITVFIDKSGLAEGNYTGEIEITAGEQRAVVAVDLTFLVAGEFGEVIYLPVVTR